MGYRMCRRKHKSHTRGTRRTEGEERDNCTIPALQQLQEEMAL